MHAAGLEWMGAFGRQTVVWAELRAEAVRNSRPSSPEGGATSDRTVSPMARASSADDMVLLGLLSARGSGLGVSGLPGSADGGGGGGSGGSGGGGLAGSLHGTPLARLSLDLTDISFQFEFSAETALRLHVESVFCGTGLDSVAVEGVTVLINDHRVGVLPTGILRRFAKGLWGVREGVWYIFPPCVGLLVALLTSRTAGVS